GRGHLTATVQGVVLHARLATRRWPFGDHTHVIHRDFANSDHVERWFHCQSFNTFSGNLIVWDTFSHTCVSAHKLKACSPCSCAPDFPKIARICGLTTRRVTRYADAFRRATVERVRERTR